MIDDKIILDVKKLQEKQRQIDEKRQSDNIAKSQLLEKIQPKIEYICSQYGVDTQLIRKNYERGTHYTIWINYSPKRSLIKIHRSYISIRAGSESHYPCLRAIAEFLSEVLDQNFPVKIRWRKGWFHL